MTDKQLSPAAQAVLDAAMNTPIVLGDYDATRSHQIASSLRALVSECETYGGTYMVKSNDILEIAKGLEGK